MRVCYDKHGASPPSRMLPAVATLVSWAFVLRTPFPLVLWTVHDAHPNDPLQSCYASPANASQWICADDVDLQRDVSADDSF
jgi:hypothetical protein